MIFKLYGLNFEQKQHNKINTKNIKIDKLEVTDYIHEYKDKNLQTLISTKEVTI